MMDPELKRVLRGLQEAGEFAKTYRFEMTEDLKVDLTLVMKGFDFETVWNERRVFVVEGVEIPTARLTRIVASKQAAGQKDQLFLATHKDALEQLLTKQNLD
jgi:hypothetical protein